MDKNYVIIISILLLGGLTSFAFGYLFLAENNSPKHNNTSNLTVNDTIKNGTQIEYSSEYITFSRAKSIAKNNAQSGVTVSDPILIKDAEGRAVYVCYYYYKGNNVGGIIIDARTGKVLYKEIYIPSSTYSSDDDYTYLCDECNGNGWLQCVMCDGSGYDEYGDICYYCDGYGYIDCENCGGDGTVGD
ncbi:MAG: PepSY domain-containing protein [Methanobacteriaceae archaeon]|nr:PepSY domain-containing protein [Methanobacteriaceae archaeon]